MPAQVSGVKSRIITQAEETIKINSDGLATITVVEMIPAAQFQASLQKAYAPHPKFRNAQSMDVEATKSKDGQFYRVTTTYQGIFGSASGEASSGGGLPDPTSSVSISTSEEPIQTHPKFKEFAGTPSDPKNGAIFIDPETGKPTKNNEKGVFREFGFGSKFEGVDSYLNISCTYTVTSYQATKPKDSSDVGKISSPPGAPKTSGRNWLYTGMEYTRRGGVYEVRKSWLMSGPGGWKKEIYS